MSFKYIICNNCGQQAKKATTEVKRSKSGKMYCSRSCAAKINNQEHPKRKMEGLCKCGKPIHKFLTYCSYCYQISLIDDKTYGELKGVTKYQKNSRIRGHARKKYLKSNLTKCCVLCEYSTHIDICHIKEISSFPDNATIKEINDLSNLIALCKNHHWEFDHNLLSTDNKNKVKEYLETK
jgi:hypothetical protein